MCYLSGNVDYANVGFFPRVVYFVVRVEVLFLLQRRIIHYIPLKRFSVSSKLDAQITWSAISVNICGLHVNIEKLRNEARASCPAVPDMCMRGNNSTIKTLIWLLIYPICVAKLKEIINIQTFCRVITPFKYTYT